MEDNKNLYDVIVVGGGPAGLTAAIYLARAQYRVLVVEKERFGGQITITSEVVNYPGIWKTNGESLTGEMRRQAEGFGAEFLLAEAEALELTGKVKTVKTTKGELQCFGVLIATGAHPRMIGFPGEEAYRGHGVAYCATCDGEFFTGMEVFVVGGGFAAAEESVFLTKYAGHVTVLVREDDFTCAKAVSEETKKHPKITVLYNTEVREVSGDSVLRRLVYENNKTGERTEYKAEEGKTFGVFVFAGYEPATKLVKGLVKLNEQGYVITDISQKTSVDGVYAAGDVCVKNLRQVVTAVGDGAVAATELERYAGAMYKETGLVPKRAVSKVSREDTSVPKGEAAVPGAGISGSGVAGAGVSGAGSAETGVSGSGSAGAGGSGLEASGAGGALFTEDMLAQLHTVFERMENPLVLELYLDERPVSEELRHYMESLAELTDKLTVSDGGRNVEYGRPYVRILRTNGTPTGLGFHGVPGGHEFSSFIMGLYNAAGKGQAVDDAQLARISDIDNALDLKIMVSLSCTMCPELVTSAQKIASLNDRVNAEVYDINHFGELREKYHVMSVPCMVLNDEKVSFGRKNIEQILDWIAM